MRTGAGALRPHWEGVWPALEALGPEGLALRAASLERLLRDEGVTYVDAAVEEVGALVRRRAWHLDPVPLVIDSSEWRAIEAGLVQRAELLDLVLSDLHGPRSLIRAGVLPAELAWGNPGLSRAGVRVPGPHQLVLCAADLARGPDGRMVVLADRLEVPAGVGYAIVNRLVMARAFPSLYRDAQVHHPSLFLRALRAALSALAPPGTAGERVAILTPGAQSPTYYEHASLAAQLGYPLVESADLEVRGGVLWIRALSGPERVDVLVRRVGADHLDPLELRPDSTLGVPGLLHAARDGAVTIVNPPGVAALEHPALSVFLPVVARHLLGGDLTLDGPPAWWCGHDTGRSHVLAHLDRLVLRQAGDRTSGRTLVGASLSAAKRAEVVARIEAAPHAWVGREFVEPSTVPTLAGAQLVDRPVTVRAFLVAHEGSYMAMAGGLVRAGGTTGDLAAGVGGRGQNPSKDAWVLSSEPAPPVPVLRRVAAGPSVALAGRAAEHMLTIGRRAERAELCVRLLRTILARVEEPFDDAGGDVLDGLLGALWALMPPGTAAAGESRSLGGILDPAEPTSLVSTLRALVDAAFSVQEQLSGDTWQVLADIEVCVAQLEGRPPEVLPSDLPELATLTRCLLALSGLAVESMVRDAAWSFLDGGRRLERAGDLLTVLSATLVPVRPAPVEALLLESVLVAFDSIIDYRRRFPRGIDVAGVVDQLVFDADNPRSLRHALDRLADDLAALPRRYRRGQLNTEEAPVLDARTTLDLADVAALSPDTSPGSRRVALDGLFGRIGELLAVAQRELSGAYFAAPAFATLAGALPEGDPP